MRTLFNTNAYREASSPFLIEINIAWEAEGKRRRGRRPPAAGSEPFPG
jgi:hypothetical protein